MKPIPGTFPGYFNSYIDKVSEEDLSKAFEKNKKEIIPFLKTIPENTGDFAYTAGKWSIKQLILHISDSERVFSYRALRFARGDSQQPLSFDENLYAENSNANKRTLASVIEEYEAVNLSTIHLFQSFSDNGLLATGNTSAGKLTVNALGFVICGHAIHHSEILKSRYLKLS